MRRALVKGSIVQGEVEEFGQVFLKGVVQDVLLRVSRDFGLSYTELMSRYEKVVVDTHVSNLTAEENHRGNRVICHAMSSRGKRCSKRACINGYCKVHAVAAIERDAARKVAEAYASSVTSRPATEAVAARMLVELGADTTAGLPPLVKALPDTVLYSFI
jgi:hypothetical protein